MGNLKNKGHKTKIKNIRLFLMAFCFMFDAVRAQTTSQTLCFIDEKNKNVELLLRKYLDESIQKEIGAFVKYSTSKTIIPLVYIDDSTTDEFVDYELYWLEVFDKKVIGEYRLLKPKMATIQAAYVKYKNYRTGKETIFSPSGKSDDDCVVAQDVQ